MCMHLQSCNCVSAAVLLTCSFVNLLKRTEMLNKMKHFQRAIVFHAHAHKMKTNLGVLWIWVCAPDKADAAGRTGVTSLLGSGFQVFVYRTYRMFSFLGQCSLFRTVRDTFIVLVVINRSYELSKVNTPARHFRAVICNKKRHISLNEYIFIQRVIHLASIKCNPLWISWPPPTLFLSVFISCKIMNTAFKRIIVWLVQCVAFCKKYKRNSIELVQNSSRSVAPIFTA